LIPSPPNIAIKGRDRDEAKPHKLKGDVMAAQIDRDQSTLPLMIPRELLFGNPQRWQPTLSPDGRMMAWLAPDARDVRQVWVCTLNGADERCVTNDRHRGISFYGWAWDSKTILYIQDSDGDENYHLFAVKLETGNVPDLTPWQGVRCEFVAADPKYPDQVVAALNVRDRKNMDVWRIGLISGDTILDTENPGDVVSWLADDNFVVRGATAITAQGSSRFGSVTTQPRRGARWQVQAPMMKWWRWDSAKMGASCFSSHRLATTPSGSSPRI
jgi:dipeptidyl aminopeptidase/acylaminoacyl peptidase